MVAKQSWQEMIWNGLTANFGTKLISVAIAVVLWMIVLYSRNIEVTKDVPLDIITAADVVPGNDVPDRIAFRLSGPKAFLQTLLDRKEDPIQINLSTSKPGTVTYRFFSDNIRVPIGVKVMAITPPSVLIKLEHLKRREVPLKLELKGALPDGFRIARTEIKPDVVRVKGAESRVDGLSEIVSNPVDVSGLKQTTERPLSLDLSRYSVQLDGDLPRAIVEVEPLSANFRIKNVEVRVLSDREHKLDEKTVNVLVRADPKDLKALSHARIYGVVDLSGKPKGKYTESIKIILPEGVGLVRVVPDKVNVTLE